MLLAAKDLHKAFPLPSGGQQPVLSGISLTLAAGETLALTGESGSGKSTLLHLLAGLDRPDSGTVTLNDLPLSALPDAARAEARRSHIGLVFQQFNLIPSLDVAANLAFQARLAGRHDARWCATLAERLGLAPHLSAWPETLSGGQQQRLAIGRALAARPPLILADEPTGNLDEENAEAVLALMLELAAETSAALVIVTHSPRVAAAMSRRLHLSRGQLA
ncbi:MAG: ABC transporter ATP-binding protein [Vannielia sp.]|uniref:ABC transporter ATP-binding protein n=1 Tax=Rhodobacterales TaxID=204455 RepID=UPI002094F916|nr:ABC transporter ATP-binding protein [Oceanicola sp. 502str15]MCO6381292.1 ATP-binding cassette domain-containing protein [Oceanicola sp. 502str15]